MRRDNLLDLFRRSGALLDGHFRLSSGLHSTGYLQCALVLSEPRSGEAIGAALASRVSGLGATVVLSPALGGVVIGQEVGRALGVRANLRRTSGRRAHFAAGFHALSESDRVLVVEDVLTTGGSTRETMQVAMPRQAAASSASRRLSTEAAERRHSTYRLKRCSPSIFPPTSRTSARSARRSLPVVKPGSRPDCGLSRTPAHESREGGGERRAANHTRAAIREMPSFKLTIAVRQDEARRPGSARPSGTSVQGLLEDALGELDGQPVKPSPAPDGPTQGSTRSGQVASASLERAIDAATLVRALVDASAPRRAAARGGGGRRSRFTRASTRRAKTYRYRIWNTDVISPFEGARYVHVGTYPDRNSTSRRWPKARGTSRGASPISPRSRYRAPSTATTVREIFSSAMRAMDDEAGLTPTRVGVIAYDVTGDGFLRHMVCAPSWVRWSRSDASGGNPSGLPRLSAASGRREDAGRTAPAERPFPDECLL